MLLLDNPIQPYAWGPVDGLSELVGSSPSGGHEAELWVGTHPCGPSVVAAGSTRAGPSPGDRGGSRAVARADPGRRGGRRPCRSS